MHHIPSGTDHRSKGNRTYHFSVTFSVVFQHPDDVCYLAYHFPYTLTDHLEHLVELERLAKPQQCMVRQLLCRTLSGNRCDLLTITSFLREDLEEYPVLERVQHSPTTGSFYW